MFAFTYYSKNPFVKYLFRVLDIYLLFLHEMHLNKHSLCLILFENFKYLTWINLNPQFSMLYFTPFTCVFDTLMQF